MSIRHYLVVVLLLLTCLATAGQKTDDESWIYGKWELSYDPDGARTDWLEFLPNGDARSLGPQGDIEGLYIVDGSTVKAVFTWKGKDIIMYFHADRKRGLLRIVTSKTGKPSIYKKVHKP